MNNPQTKAILERVSFQMRHTNIRASEKADALISYAKENYPAVYGKYSALFDEVFWIIPLTAGINFNFTGDEAPMLIEFRDFWTAFIAASNDEPRQIQLIMDWRMETHRDIVLAWYEAANHANYPVKHELVPETALSPDEQEALKDKASPLA